MIRNIPTKERNSSSVSEYINDKWETSYFHMYCDICGVKHPLVCVNGFSVDDILPKALSLGNCELCWDCQEDLWPIKNRKCKSCRKTFKNFRKVVKLFYLDKILYFCNYKCYHRFVKLNYPASKQKWAKMFSQLSPEKKKIYYSKLGKVKSRIKMLKSDFGDKFEQKKIQHCFMWERPKT